MSTRKRTDWLIVHCSATTPAMNIGAKEIDQWHRRRGWLGIGYHFVIRRDGTVEKGREITEVGAHVEGYNSSSIGICLVGGVNDTDNPENNFTPEQFVSLEKLLRDVIAEYPTAKITGHRRFAKKACPSFDVEEWLKEKGMNAYAAD